MKRKKIKTVYLTIKNSILLLLCCICIVSCTETNKKIATNVTATVDIMNSEVLVDAAIIESWGLVDQGQKLADQGKTVDEIIKTLPTGTLVSSNSNSIIFFIEGSIPMIIELEANQKTQTKGGSANSTIERSINAPQSLVSRPFTTSFSDEDELLDVIGSERGDDERQIKKALILAPFNQIALNQNGFKGSDDADIAYKYLSANRNYKDNILFRKENITLEDFTSFDKYDLVHLSTHGLNHCVVKKIDIAGGYDLDLIDVPIGECIMSIATGIEHGFNDIKDEAQIAEYKKKYQKYGGAILLSKTKIYLKPLFFDYFYKKGITNNVEIKGELKDKIWIFSACQLGQNGMTRLIMEDVLEDSHFLYWENSVGIKDAKITYTEFYNNLVFKGLNVSKSFEEIPLHLRKDLTLGIDSYTDVDSTFVFYEKTTSLEHIQTGEPRHGIEVIDMLHPKNENLIQKGDFYELTGDFNDGEDEAITLKVKLIGYTKAEFLEKKMSVSLEVDGKVVLSKHTFLPDVSGDNSSVESIKEHEYGVIVTITEIAIPDVGTKEELTLKATLHLNNEHVSIHKETVTIVSYGIIATTERRGRKSKFTYDGKRKTGKYEIGTLPVVYHDDQGYKYVKSNSSGWKKVNMRKMTGTNSNLDLRTRTLINFPLVGYALIFKINEFEKTEEYTKTKVDCGLPVKCSEFNTSSGVKALFNPNGKLIKFKTPSQTINFEYGNYEVILPEAGIPKKVKEIEDVMSGKKVVQK